MNIQFRIMRQLLDAIREDLRRPHLFAYERVGVIYCRFARLREGELVVFPHRYIAVPDEHYVDDSRFGATIGSDAFRDIIQRVYDEPVGAFHVHMHPGRGIPRPSRDDLRETKRFVPDFFHGRQDVPHGAVILSKNSMSARVWLSEDASPVEVSDFRIVGFPMQRIGGFE